MGFFSQEYWSGLPFPPPGDLPDPRIEPMPPVSPALPVDSLPAELNCIVPPNLWQYHREEMWMMVKHETTAEGKMPGSWIGRKLISSAVSVIQFWESAISEIWRQEEKGRTEDEMVGWHYWLDGHEFEEALGVGDGQGSLGCYSPWGCKESDTTEWLNWISKNKEKAVKKRRP